MSAVLIEPTELPVRMEIPGMVGTEEEFWRICQKNPDRRIEREANGDILVMAPTGWNTGEQNADLLTDLQIWARSYGGAVIDSSGGFKLPNGAIRSPDATWICKQTRDSISEEERKGIPHLVPDFIVEIVSPSDSLAKQIAKMEEYAANGVLLGWLIIPEKREVQIYRAGEDKPEVVTGATELQADEDVLPGFVLNLSRIW